MRTTLDIDQDVLAAVKELAAAQRRTAGKILSELARASLQRGSSTESQRTRNGFELLEPSDTVVTVELVEQLIDEEP